MGRLLCPVWFECWPSWATGLLRVSLTGLLRPAVAHVGWPRGYAAYAKVGVLFAAFFHLFAGRFYEGGHFAPHVVLRYWRIGLLKVLHDLAKDALVAGFIEVGQARRLRL